VQEDKDLIRLDDLIANLGGTVNGTHTAGPCGLLLEHLQAARRDRLGSMRGEYVLSLNQAKESVACISDKSVRVETKKILQSLLDSKVSLLA
jgi:hypothetical protein